MRVTIARTIFWNSSKHLVMVVELVQAAAKPTNTENTNALITLMIGAIFKSKSSFGKSFKPSTAGVMFKEGIML